ncbi:MAG: iron-containing alcohol dehydrogenase, partial [Vogesella sp.]|nr:iron-containing alcohol dehydrogenase [Vogesella sp.]
MAVSEFHIPALNLMGAGSVQKAVDAMQARGLRRTLIVTDTGLVKAGLVAQVQQQLAAADIQSFVFDGVQ